MFGEWKSFEYYKSKKITVHFEKKRFVRAYEWLSCLFSDSGVRRYRGTWTTAEPLGSRWWRTRNWKNREIWVIFRIFSNCRKIWCRVRNHVPGTIPDAQLQKIQFLRFFIHFLWIFVSFSTDSIKKGIPDVGNDLFSSPRGEKRLTVRWLIHSFFAVNFCCKIQ